MNDEWLVWCIDCGEFMMDRRTDQFLYRCPNGCDPTIEEIKDAYERECREIHEWVAGGAE